jgi:hypothetical protein
MLKRMKEYADSILRDQQAGFRKVRSRTEQIATLQIILKQPLEWYTLMYIKGIVSKNAWEKFAEKNNHYHFRSNNYDVLTAAALCIQNILDVTVLKNIYHLPILNMKW